LLCLPSSNCSNMLKKGLTILLLCLIGFLIVNKAVYTHVHEENGVLVVHSHPFNKSADSDPIKEHSHTKAQLFITHQLEILFALVFLFVAIMLTPIEHLKPKKSDKVKAQLSIFYSPLRAPPTC
jgi:predicted membrane protein